MVSQYDVCVHCKPFPMCVSSCKLSMYMVSQYYVCAHYKLFSVYVSCYVSLQVVLVSWCDVCVHIPSMHVCVCGHMVILVSDLCRLVQDHGCQL